MEKNIESDKITTTVEEEEISPASMPNRSSWSWEDDLKASFTEVEGDNVVKFLSGGGFRYCRTKESYLEGSQSIEVEVDFEGKDGQVSIGISNNDPLSCDAGVYYFTGAYIYCNYYPSFTKDYNNIHTTAPKKLNQKGTVKVDFDFDEKTIQWTIDNVEHDAIKVDFSTDKPYYVVVGMFTGIATII